MKLEISRQILEKYKKRNIMKISPVGAELFHCKIVCYVMKSYCHILGHNLCVREKRNIHIFFVLKPVYFHKMYL
jgi:hypothetical protein